MKVWLYSSASAVALIALAGPAFADDSFSGVGQLYVGGGTAEGSVFTDVFLDDPFLYGGKAQGYWTLSPEVHLQADLFGHHTDDLFVGGEGSNDTDTSRFGGALHLLHPLENRARLGVAGSIWSTDVSVFNNGPGDGTFRTTDAAYGLVAVESQFFGSDWTLSGQAGVFTAFSCDGDSGPGCVGTVDGGTYLRGKIRYFLNDNTQLSLEGMQMWGSVDDDLFSGKSISARSTTWTLEAEHKFHGSPFAGFVALAHQSDDFTGFLTSTADVQTVTLGVKFYLDQSTLKTNDRSGAALDTPTFGTALETATPNSLVGLVSP